MLNLIKKKKKSITMMNTVEQEVSNMEPYIYGPPFKLSHFESVEDVDRMLDYTIANKVTINLKSRHAMCVE